MILDPTYKIDKENRKVRPEKKGYVVFIELKTGDRIIGRIVKSDSTTLYVETLNEPKIIKDVHRVFIKRRFVILEGGKGDRK